MKKMFFVMVSILVSGLFCGASFSVAGDVEDPANAVDFGLESSAPGAIADKNYILDVWASSGTASDSTAERVFSSGSTVRLHINYYMAAAGTVLRYYMVGNAAGSLSEFSAYSASVSTGQDHKYISLSSLAPGTYFFTAAIIIAGNNVFSPTPYWFVIE